MTTPVDECARGVPAVPAPLSDGLTNEGREALAYVVQCLRDTGRVVDEEGETTDALDALLKRLDARGVRVVRSCPATRPECPHSCTEHDCDALAPGVAMLHVPGDPAEAAWLESLPPCVPGPDGAKPE